jgi:REP element-mobilizing transposase RayT
VGEKSLAIYNINYHIVWCTKFRKPILVGKVKEFVEEQLDREYRDNSSDQGIQDIRG